MIDKAEEMPSNKAEVNCHEKRGKRGVSEEAQTRTGSTKKCGLSTNIQGLVTKNSFRKFPTILFNVSMLLEYRREYQENRIAYHGNAITRLFH